MNETKTWELRLHITERDSETSADIKLVTEAGVVTGHGTARRNPRDSDVPQIGDRLAASRALSQLAHELLDSCAQQISEIEHHPVRLSH